MKEPDMSDPYKVWQYLLKSGRLSHQVAYVFEFSGGIPWTGRALRMELNRLRKNRGQDLVTKFDLVSHLRKDDRYRLLRLAEDPDDNIWVEDKSTRTYG